MGKTILEREDREKISLLTHLKIKLIIFKINIKCSIQSHFAYCFIKTFFWEEEKTKMYKNVFRAVKTKHVKVERGKPWELNVCIIKKTL